MRNSVANTKSLNQENNRYVKSEFRELQEKLDSLMLEKDNCKWWQIGEKKAINTIIRHVALNMRGASIVKPKPLSNTGLDKISCI